MELNVVYDESSEDYREAISKVVVAVFVAVVRLKRTRCNVRWPTEQGAPRMGCVALFVDEWRVRYITSEALLCC